MIEVITPAQVRKMRKDYIPECVFAAINELIVKHFNGIESCIEQNEILNKICTEETGLSRSDVFKYHYLDIEEIYGEKGWQVEYHKPDYNDFKDKAYFRFIEKFE